MGRTWCRIRGFIARKVTPRLLLLAVVTLALAGCGSSGTAIPKMGDRTLDQGYALLRAQGFRVRVAYYNKRSIPVSSLETLGIGHIFPAPGTHVAPGSVVTLVPQIDIISDPTGALHATYYRVPDFAGRPAREAMRWAREHDIVWDIPHLPSLTKSPARSLFAAYVVTAQRPAAGKVIRSTGWLTLTVTPRR